MSKINKKKLPSRHTSLGPDRAPHRSFYYAMGETEQDVAKPFVGVVSTWNEAAPCNTALMRQAQSVKKGVKENGGRRRFATDNYLIIYSYQVINQYLLYPHFKQRTVKVITGLVSASCRRRWQR